MSIFDPKILGKDWYVGNFFTYSEDSDVIGKSENGDDFLISRIYSRAIGSEFNQEHAKAFAAVPELLAVYADLKTYIHHQRGDLGLLAWNRLIDKVERLESRHAS